MDKKLETPFNMLIVGATNCGKTYYLLSMLEKEYMRHFDYIIIICPVFSYNKTYTDWKYIHDIDVHAIECPQENVEGVLQYVCDIYKGSNTLIIVDDCASSKSIKNRVGNITKLAFSAKHLGLSVIVISQQLTSIAKTYRENISKLVTFYNPSKKDMKSITDDYLNGVSKDEIKDIMEELRKIKYARLEIVLRHPYSHEVLS